MPLSQIQLKRYFGNFSYDEDSRRAGAILIDPHWITANIVQFKTRFGRFPCHKKVYRQMKGFVVEADMHGHVHDIGGIWVPRHVMWDRHRPISGHAYGCEIDINVQIGKDGHGGDINYGQNSYQPPELVAIAKSWGFEWGGSWRHNKDGMHFACTRLSALQCKGVILKMNDHGDNVEILQRLLNYTNRVALATDGIFGPRTNEAVIDFQQDQGLVVDGIVGMNTWGALLDWRE